MNGEYVSLKTAEKIREMHTLVQELKKTIKTIKKNNARSIDTEVDSIRRRESVARYDVCTRLERLISKYERNFK